MFLSSRKYDPKCSSRIQILDPDLDFFYPSRIPDPQLCVCYIQRFAATKFLRLRYQSSFEYHYSVRYSYTEKNSVAEPDPGTGVFQTPRFGKGKKNQDPYLGWTSRIIFPRAWKQFFGLKYLNSLMRFRDPESLWPWIRDLGWKKIRIRNPG